MEVGNIIDGLTNPPNDSTPAFHVVAPSIPGFAFSPAPKKTGFGPKEAANAFNSLMLQLGYYKYLVQGGDFGGIILRHMAVTYPEHVVSALCNFYTVAPNETDWKRYRAGQTSEEENTSIQKYSTYVTKESSYRYQQSQRPLTLAIGMTDSPVGNAMWIYDLMQNSVDIHRWTPSEIISWTMMHQIPGPYSGMRFYLESQKEVR